MTAFNVLGEPELGANKIARSPTAYALYNNPIAIAERDAAAPHLNTTPLVQIFTSSTTWVVPDGVTRVKATATGGGQGGYAGNAGGGSPTGGTGGTTSLARGATNLVRATGGSSSGAGNGTHGDLFIKGGDGDIGKGVDAAGGLGGTSFWGGCERQADSVCYGSGGYGGTGGDEDPPSWAGGRGGEAGGTAIGWISVTPGETLTITVGAAGAGGTPGSSGVAGWDGAPGILVVEY